MHLNDKDFSQKLRAWSKPYQCWRENTLHMAHQWSMGHSAQHTHLVMMLCLLSSIDSRIGCACSATETLDAEDKFSCDTCGCLQEAQKRIKIKQLPNILCLHLKRFKYIEDLQRSACTVV